MAIEAVLPDGSIFRPVLADLGAPEAARVFRWGIGPYLNGLFLQGGFGIVTNITVALARRPETMKAFVMSVSERGTLRAAYSGDPRDIAAFSLVRSAAST